MNRTIVTSLVICIALITLTGCQKSQESDSGLIQRARLVGNENLQLKKQLEEKDLKIAQLEKDIEQLKTEKAQAAQKAGDTNFRIMQIVAETEKKNQALVQENEKLKQELKKLKVQ
ncbi:MAG: hypothetical protein ISS71_09250 [Phycisphaerae bacterium]|nr:hypothetical protein [Phycisphaerae bacterium]